MLRRYGGWKSCGVGVVAVAVLAFCASVASADVALSGWIVKVSADSGSLHDEYVVNFSGQTLAPGDWFDWDLAMDGGGEYTFQNGLGKLKTLSLSLSSAPEATVQLGFSLVTGSSGTVFTISSASLPCSVTNGEAYGSAGVTVTDGEPYNTATLEGRYDGNTKAFQASVNGAAWHTAVPNPPTTAMGGTSVSPYPPAGFGPESVPGSVTDISTEFKFRLTPYDKASGTSNFVLVPEPATLALIALGMVAVRRKR